MIRVLSFMRPPDIENDIKSVAQNNMAFSCVIIMILIQFNLNGDIVYKLSVVYETKTAKEKRLWKK